MAPPEDNEAVAVVGNLQVMDHVLLPSNECDRASSITSKVARGRFLASRRLLRGILSKWLSEEPDQIAIGVTAAGKPFLSAHRNLDFSISHSGEFVIVAFSKKSIGVDLEMERPVDARGLARRFFSHKEARHLECHEDIAHFFRLWTSREAAIKGDGSGMASLLGSTSVVEDAVEFVTVKVGQTSWHVVPRKMEGGYHAALALRVRPSLISWCDLG